MSYDTLCQEVRAEFPDFKLVPKLGSRLMRAIDLFLRVLSFGRADGFMADYTTTLGTTLYTPLCWGLMSEWQRMSILRHERVHMRQARRYTGLLFSLAYLLLPLPVGVAYCRAKFEMEAYEESIRARFEHFGRAGLSAEFREEILSQFTGAAYLWMWPFRADLERWYDNVVARITASR